MCRAHVARNDSEEKSMDTLLLEIGTEEIPAGYIAPALAALAASLGERLDAARIAHGPIETMGTPRRLAVTIEDVARRQRPETTRVLGPPQRVGMNAEGALTLAGEKFAQKMGLPFSRVEVFQTEKGPYLGVTVTDKGLASIEVLKGLLPEAILALPFPKSMRWGDLKIAFARPIHTLVALLGGRTIPFSLGNVKSGRTTTGHRFMAPAPIRLAEAAEYLPLLRQAKVLVDPRERRKRLLKEIAAAARKAGGAILEDGELVDTVTHLVEWPVPVVGRFDPGYLEIPDEILITAMREHQKYFAVTDPASGALMPMFIAVNNTRGRNMALIARGHERVLRARLEDARFFFRSDLQKRLEARVADLKGVLFQAQLGSLLEKTERVRQLAAWLAGEAGAGKREATHAARAAWLCKADLVSHVVGEFPRLQGVMGRIYAAQEGEAPAVAAAIEEHYRPTASGGALPASQTGALLAIADKLDSICGCFGVGLLPTGASDPYALRRQGIGIVQILNSRGWGLSLPRMIDKAIAGYGERLSEPSAATAARVYDFLRGRIAHLLVEQGLSKDVVAAVVEATVDHVPHTWGRAEALEAMKRQPDFEALAAAFKRVVNILRKSAAPDQAPGAVEPKRFQHPSEGELHAAVTALKRSLATLLRRGDFAAALREIATLRGAVDRFFEGVLVVAEDAALRRNRLALLGEIADLFGAIADFSKIATR
jgi:glycyl-tRNA synthetase beta chain